ncbi:FHA domain-containing protein [Actinotalea sp.]|uniref:FHA domain-containing protein n=1 Tax=Actinotalea sp. TaxID=1872145 RepID=UPI0035689D54
MTPTSKGRIVPDAPHERVSSPPYRALEAEVEETQLREARSKVAYAPTRAQTRPRATLLLWDNRVVVLDGAALVGRNPSPREGEALPVQVIAVLDRGRSVSKTHFAMGVDADGVWLKDRSSTNGTVVTLTDGQQILCAPEQLVRVPVGASVAFGDYWLTVAG